MKLENENLKGKLTQVISLSTIVSTSSSERGNDFKENPRFAKIYRMIVSSKATCHYYRDKSHIRFLFYIKNVKVPNDTITLIPKCYLTNFIGPNSLVLKFPV